MLLASEVDLGAYLVQGCESRPLVMRLLLAELESEFAISDDESLGTLGFRPTFLLRIGVWAILVHKKVYILLPWSQRECHLTIIRRRRSRWTSRGTRRFARSGKRRGASAFLRGARYISVPFVRTTQVVLDLD